MPTKFEELIMSFFKPKLLPLCASFFGTLALSSMYASFYSNFDTGSYQAAKNSSLGFLLSSFDSLVRRKGSFFDKAFWCAYQTSGLLAFCKWHETGSKIAFLWGAMTLVHQVRWAYNASTPKSIFTIDGDDKKQQPHPPAGDPPPYQVPPANATLPSAPPAADYGVYIDPDGVASYPSTTAFAPSDYVSFTATSANSVGGGLYR